MVRINAGEGNSIERTVCRSCHGGCGVLVELQDGAVTKISGDPAHPQTQGFICSKGHAAAGLPTHPDRLVRPLRRIGPRGSGRFAEIEWDEAIGLIAERLLAERERGNPESVVFCQGTDRNYLEWVFRFANAFGSPNVLGPAHICFYPRLLASLFTCGDMTFVDYDGQPECIMLWGSNKPDCHSDGVIGTGLSRAIKRGAELIVIDPRRTRLTDQARYWLRPRPGSDTALALGMINVIIARRAYDEDFVRDYASGFEALAEHVRGYDPERVEALTWVPAKLIEEAAIHYARAASAAIEIGTGVEQNSHAFQAARAIKILSGLCGNIDRPGGDVIWDPSGIIGRRDLPASELLPQDSRDRRLGAERHRLLGLMGWANPEAVWTAILERQPYPVSALLVFGSNLLNAYADSERVYQALNTVDFLVVADLFRSPTAEMADVILPISSWLERDQIVEFNSSLAARRKLCQVGECRSDEEVLTALAHAVGLGEQFWTETRESLDARLAPIGLDWAALCKQGYIQLAPRYEKYRESSFRTRSGKFLFANPGLEQFGYSALPQYVPPMHEPRGYVLTSAHSPYFFNSEFRNLATLRNKEPDPLVRMHPDAVAAEGLQEGDWIEVATHNGFGRFKLRCDDSIDSRVVVVSASWWYPELPWPESWQQSNLNRLTTEQNANPETGSSVLRGFVCTIRPVHTVNASEQ